MQKCRRPWLPSDPKHLLWTTKTSANFSNSLASVSIAKKTFSCTIPFVAIKICKHMKSATLLAEALFDSVFDQRRQLKVVFADAVALVVLLLLGEVFLTPIHLRSHIKRKIESLPHNTYSTLSLFEKGLRATCKAAPWNKRQIKGGLLQPTSCQSSPGARANGNRCLKVIQCQCVHICF